jgi:hypothetical protein
MKRGFSRSVGGVLQPPAVDRHPERHVGGDRRHREALEQRAEIGIGPAVEDDEAGIHRHRAGAVGPWRLHRVGMATDATFLLEDRDLVSVR